MPDSIVAQQFWNAKPTQINAVRNFEAATGGRPEAVAALQDYAAFDLLRTAINPQTGQINPTKYLNWLKSHQDLLAHYPELLKRFRTVASAQAQVDNVQAARDALSKQFEAATGTNSTVLQKYFKRGAAGADGIDAYMRETGGTPEAVAAMTGHIGADLRAKAAQTGKLNVPVYRNWLAANGPALERLGVKDTFSTPAKAQEALEAASAQRLQATKDYEASAARHWLKSEPLTAVTNALSKRAGNDPVANIKGIMKLTEGDASAQQGVKAALRDWLVGKGVSGKEAGQSGTDYMKIQKMQDLVKDNHDALSAAFSPEEMTILDQVAASLKQTDRSISGSKAPIGPGTARDLHAGVRYGGKKSALMSAIMSSGARIGTMVVGEHLFGGEGSILGMVAHDAVHAVGHAAKASRQETVKDLIIGALADPQEARILLTHATPENVTTLTQRLATRMMQVAVGTTGQTLPN